MPNTPLKSQFAFLHYEKVKQAQTDEALGCWNANVVVNSDLGGAAWHHACNFVVFDAALSIPAAAYLSVAARPAFASMLCYASKECLQPQVEEDMTQERMSEIVKAAIVRILAGQTILTCQPLLMQMSVTTQGGVSASGVVTLSVAVSADNTSFLKKEESEGLICDMVGSFLRGHEDIGSTGRT
ncbi:hypothetical protein Tco_0819295 [Tanacetum coccineum]|uniref:Uncharacterized protein n=1 Tax=Tanacetum coccineum TaxID=301880 RepID=A0ABQ5AAH5_9ASTR